jgi:hypothetical protein
MTEAISAVRRQSLSRCADFCGAKIAMKTNARGSAEPIVGRRAVAANSHLVADEFSSARVTCARV